MRLDLTLLAGRMKLHSLSVGFIIRLLLQKATSIARWGVAIYIPEIRPQDRAIILFTTGLSVLFY